MGSMETQCWGPGITVDIVPVLVTQKADAPTDTPVTLAAHPIKSSATVHMAT